MQLFYRLRELRLFILEKAPGRPPSNLPDLKGGCKRPEEACRDRKRGSGFKMKIIRLRLYIRKKFLRVKVLRHWHSLLREAVDALSLDMSYK